MDENRDRLIDILLRQELGGEHPPDLSGRIVARAFPRRPMRWRAYLAAACVLLALGGSVWWWLRPGYPEPRVSGAYEVVGGGRLQRGASVRTKDKAALLELGGYCRVDIKPSSTVRIDGDKFAESVLLEQGEVQCSVEGGLGAFQVHTLMGQVAVVGTQFTVRVVEERGGTDQAEKWVMVRVTGGEIALGGNWGDAHLATGEDRAFALGKDKKPHARSGTAIGVVTARSEEWIEVKTASEEKARRYLPAWLGRERGLDKAMMETIRRTPVASRVRLEWKQDEVLRVTKLEVLPAPEVKEGDKKK